jgi:hypothetical protein
MFSDVRQLHSGRGCRGGVKSTFHLKIGTAFRLYTCAHRSPPAAARTSSVARRTAARRHLAALAVCFAFLAQFCSACADDIHLCSGNWLSSLCLRLVQSRCPSQISLRNSSTHLQLNSSLSPTPICSICCPFQLFCRCMCR